MCRLCERDKEWTPEIIDNRNGRHFVKVIEADRLAVLETDHRAMERLRNTRLEILRIDGGWRIQYPPEDYKPKLAKAAYKPEDLADAILSVKEEDGKDLHD